MVARLETDCYDNSSSISNEHVLLEAEVTNSKKSKNLQTLIIGKVQRRRNNEDL